MDPATSISVSGVLTTPLPAAIRDELTDMVIRDLLGPAGGPEEELNQYEDHVYGRYLVGMLAPQDSEIAGGELDELAVGDGDEGEEGNAEVVRYLNRLSDLLFILSRAANTRAGAEEGSEPLWDPGAHGAGARPGSS